MGTGWQGTRLVAQRGLVENVKSRSFKVVTGLLLLLSLAGVALPQILGKNGPTTYTLATAGKAPADVVATLDAAGKTADFKPSGTIKTGCSRPSMRIPMISRKALQRLTC